MKKALIIISLVIVVGTVGFFIYDYIEKNKEEEEYIRPQVYKIV